MLTVLVIGTTAGFYAARGEAIESADRRGELAAREATSAFSRQIDDLVTALGGAAAAVRDDGSLDLGVFDAYAADVLSLERVPGVGLIGIVDQGDRAAVEALVGFPFVVRDAAGALVPAPVAPTYYPLLSVQSLTANRSAVGLDYGADEVRRTAIIRATESRQTSVSDPVSLAGSGRRALLVVRPLLHTTDTSSEVVAFVGTNLPVADIEATVEAAAGDGMAVTLRHDEMVLAGDETLRADEGWSRTTNVGGSEWAVTVTSASGADLTLAWLVAGGGSLATLTIAALLFVTMSYQRTLSSQNVRLTTEERRSRAVQQVAAQLARALASREVASALVQHLPVAVDARTVKIVVRNERGEYELFDSDDDRTPRVLEVDGSGSLVETTLRTGDAAWLSSPLAWRQDEITTEMASGGNALAVLPLVTGDVRGVMAVSYQQVHIFSEQEQALLATVGLLAARAIDRGRRYDDEHRAAVAFQQAALPAQLPEVPGWTVAAQYRPAWQGGTAGGDWYDVLRLDDHRYVLVVGDVVGHSMEAAATMGRLRTAFQVIASYHSDPGAMLRAMNEQVEVIPDAFCTTMLVLVADTADGTISWSRAGHPPAALVHDGTLEWLDEPGIPPLGFTVDPDPPVHRRPMSPGDLLILYTDALIERRGEALDDGFARMKHVVESLMDLPPRAFGDALVEALVPSELQADDLAVLVSRLDADRDRFEVALVPETSGIAEARHDFAEWLGRVGSDADVIDELSVVVSELLANGVVASSEDAVIRFTAAIEDDDVVFEVENDARVAAGSMAAPWDLADPLREGGRGLMIVRAYVDRIEVERVGDDRLVVRCRRRRTSPATVVATD